MNIQRSPVDDNKFVYVAGEVPLGEDEESEMEWEIPEAEADPELPAPDIPYIPEDAELPGLPDPTIPYKPYEDDEDKQSEIGQ